jgi:hypothetical protein
VSTESFVQVAPDGTGKQIRNLLVTESAIDGTLSSRYMQVVAIADGDGNVLNLSSERLLQHLAALVAETRLLRQAFQDWSGAQPRFDPASLADPTPRL